MKKNRIIYIDISRGIAILLMICGHVLDIGTKRNIIFSFHMPLFIILSGFFYSKRTFKDEIKNIFFKLLIPTTIVASIIFTKNNIRTMEFPIFLLELCKHITICYSFQSKIDYNCLQIGSIWFIYLLIGIIVLFYINKKISKENDLVLFFIIIIETYLGYLLGQKQYWLPWSFDVTLFCMLFYYIGYLLRKYKKIDEILSNNRILLISLMMWIVGIKYNCIELAIRFYPNGLWSCITAISGSFVILKISMCIEQKLKYISKILSWCGENSLYILYGHYLETRIFTYNFVLNKKLLFKTVKIILKCIFSICFAWIVIFLKKKFFDIRKKEKAV